MADNEKIRCVKHNSLLVPSNFYIASDESIFSGIGRIPICKKCLYDMVDDYYKTHKDLALAIYYVCRKIDVAYDGKALEGALKLGENNPRKTFQSYMTQYNSIGQKNGIHLSFDDGEHIIVDEQYNNHVGDIDFEQEEVEMTGEDRANKEEVIKLLDYDPFEGFSESDQKFLYSDLLNYFYDEDVIEDQFLVSQIIQIVNNNNQIRKLDYQLSKYMANDKLLQENLGKIKSLNATKKDIVANTDKIAKENEISVKSRKGNSVSKSSLTAMMERLRELKFEDAEVDFYDQKKAYGMQRAANISMKAMAEQISFDENDVNDIIMGQRKMIKDMENKILDLEEENRRLYAEIESTQE